LLVNSSLVNAWIDLSDLEAGEHRVPIHTQVGLTPAQVTNVEPSEALVVLEKLASVQFPVKLEVSGEPALGYRKGTPSTLPTTATVSGPESRVSQVSEVHAAIDISGANEGVETVLPLRAYDQSGQEVAGITLSPASVSVEMPVTLLGGYRNVVVKVVTSGQVAEGYWLTNVSVSPPNVIVFSTNPQEVIALPGYVETNPMDLTDLSDDVDIRATLNLPDGVTLAGEESVLVRLSIAALEGSLPITLPIEVVGLSPELEAIVSPEAVELLLTGSLPILNNLTPAGIRVSVNVAGLEPGVYQLNPVVDLLPNQVEVASILPEVVEVTIRVAPTATITPRVTAKPSLTVTGTPSPRVNPTRTPTP
jgi:YbbR domain-containing protein